jgi:hypothetical protein
MTEAQKAQLSTYQAAGIALAICFVAYKYAPMPAAGKTVVLGIAGAVLAANLPVIQDAVL